MRYETQQQRYVKQAWQRHDTLTADALWADRDGRSEDARELREAAAEWARHAERVANKLHARSRKQRA